MVNVDAVFVQAVNAMLPLLRDKPETIEQTRKHEKLTVITVPPPC